MSLKSVLTLASTLVLALTLGSLPAVPPAASALAQRPPNVVLFITDDQHYELLEYMPIVQREIAARGVNFANAYATTPLCCPSRASILTGLYAQHHGVLRNRGLSGGYRRLDASSTIATWLQQGGVRTMLLGKYLNVYQNTTVPPGWDEFYAIWDTGKKYYDYTINRNGETKFFGDDPEQYSAEVLTRYARQLLREERDRPFFLYFAFDGPHGPPEPTAQDRGAFANLAPRRVPSYNEEDVGDKPAWVQALPPLGPEEQAEIDRFRRDQVEVLQSIDRGIGSVIDLLREHRRLDNTWLIFMSDNGLSLGEHRFAMHKSCGYEDCARIPLVIAPPANRAAEFGAPRVEGGLVANIDLAPTLAEIFGVRPGAAVDGRSLLPLLADPATPWQREIGLRLWSDTDQVSFSGLRFDKWKYLLYGNGEQELYDLRADPYEIQNLAGRPELAPMLQELRSRVDSPSDDPPSDEPSSAED